VTSLKYMTKKGEASVMKGGDGDVLEVLLYAVRSTGPGKRAELYANELKIVPGGWVLGGEDKGETGYIGVLKQVALCGVGDGTEDSDSRRVPVSAVGSRVGRVWWHCLGHCCHCHDRATGQLRNVGSRLY
jgi:hypothetical protein